MDRTRHEVSLMTYGCHECRWWTVARFNHGACRQPSLMRIAGSQGPVKMAAIEHCLYFLFRLRLVP